jgi:hypothetical protein
MILFFYIFLKVKMKQLIQKNTNKWYEVDFNVKYFEKLSKKDEEKIYKILRKISS